MSQSPTAGGRPDRIEPQTSLEPAIAGLRDLQYSREAQDEYGGADLPKGEVYGVLAEIGVEGTVVIVAGFKDGTSRLIMGKGGGVLGNKDDFPPESRVAARQLVELSKSLRPRIPVERSRALPRQGAVRFAILTNGAVPAVERPIASVEDREEELAPLWSSANQLLSVLLQFMQQER